MRKVPERLVKLFVRRMAEQGLPGAARAAQLKWLRFYLDFCGKYRHRARDRESLQPFLQKLASKRQSLDRQREAEASIGLLYEIIGSGYREEGAQPAKRVERAPSPQSMKGSVPEYRN